MNEVANYKKLIAAIGAFLFISPNLNIPESILSYCGISDHSTIKLISVGIFCVLDVLLVLAFLKTRPKAKTFLLLVIFNAIYILPHVINRDITVIMQYGLFIVPTTVFAVMLSGEDDIKQKFYDYLRIAARVLMVIAVIYILMLYISEDRNDYGMITIKNMTYGDMAYLFLTGYVVSIVELVERKSPLSFIGLIVFSLAIFFAGARSAIMCIIFAAILLVFTLLISKMGKKRVMLSLLALVITIGTIAIGMVIIPDGSRLEVINKDDSSNISVENLIPETRKTKAKVFKVIYVPTGEKRRIYDIYEEEILNNDCKKSETEAKLREDFKSGRCEYIKLVEENPDDRNRVEKYFIRMNRDYLWKAAYKEFKKNPVLGNGPCYFKNKYDNYFPHNVLLEAMVDYGIVGLVLFSALGLYCFIKGLRYCMQSKSINVLLIFLLLFSHLPRYLLYTTIYCNATLAMTVVFYIALGKLAKNERKDPELDK